MAGSSRAQLQPQEQESLQQTIPVALLPSTTVSTTCTTTMESSTKISEISIRVNSRATSSQTTTLCVELSEGNSVQHISVSTSASITPGTSQTGTPDTSQSITSSTAPCMIKDSLNRPHFKVPHTGSTTVCLRSAKFHSSTYEMHIHDLKPILEAIVSERKTVVTLIVDGGPDWSTSSLLIALSGFHLEGGVGGKLPPPPKCPASPLKRKREGKRKGERGEGAAYIWVLLGSTHYIITRA